jgi:hypothetical protein
MQCPAFHWATLSPLPPVFDFSKYKTLCDMVGAGAMLSIQVAKQNPHISCTSFDLPPVEPIAKEIIQSFHLGDKIKTVQGDFFKDAFPKADIIVMGMILHDWSEEKKCQLIQRHTMLYPMVAYL